jgi:hypothetical protein
MIKKKITLYHTSDGSRMVVHTITVEVVVSQPKMSRFMITVDVSSTTF